MSSSLVAGFNNIGRPIHAVPEVKMKYMALQAASKNSGNYWALTAIRTLESLTSGNHKPNVFVSASGIEQHIYFDVLMPGCRARVVKHTNGAYRIISLEADTDYSGAQERGDAPGLYDIKDNGERPVYNSEGVITRERYPVVITDRYRTATKAADMSEPYLKEAANINTSTGHSMHFTPGEEKIGGMHNIIQASNPEKDKELRESAILLAKTMAEARGVAGIAWVSERGGSGVVTHALQILKDQGVEFKDSKHQVFFSGITTDIVKAENLARDLGFKAERKTHCVQMNLHQLIGSGKLVGGGIVSAYARYKADDSHTFLKLSSDVTAELLGGKSVIDKVATASKAAAVVGGMTVAAGANMPVLGLATALAGLAPAVFKGFFPNQYYKIKDKL